LVSCASLLIFLTPEAWALGVGALIIGIVYYQVYVRKRKLSKEKTS
jgi:hypothetical protein